MARRNMSESLTPRPLTSSNRTNTPATARNDPTNSPSPSAASDKENRVRRIDKGKGRMAPPSKLPTPTSDPIAPESRTSKRRRVNEDDEDDESTPSTSRMRRSQPEGGQEVQENGNPELESIKYYNPGQDEGERREVKRKSRALEREFNENRDDYLKSDNAGLQQTISNANEIFENVKQTSDATLDSRLMVSVSDLTYKKSAQLVLGDTSTGIDVDEFVSMCISFMRTGPQAAAVESGSQRPRRRQSRDEDNEEEDVSDDLLDWARLGSRACYPHNSRPAVPGFLLGPLSVQKRTRAPTQRRARQARDAGGQETRPEALTKEDLETNENNTVRTICGNIRSRLVQHCEEAAQAVQEMADADPEIDVPQLMREHRLTSIGGPSLFDFVINPRSFGQTVENLFYVSFLIKEGEVGVHMDEDGLPTLLPNRESMHESRERHATKHQAVFGLDYSTWQRLVDAFEIKKPLIPHRAEERATQVGSRGWYS